MHHEGHVFVGFDNLLFGYFKLTSIESNCFVKIVSACCLSNLLLGLLLLFWALFLTFCLLVGVCDYKLVTLLVFKFDALGNLFSLHGSECLTLQFGVSFSGLYNSLWWTFSSRGEYFTLFFEAFYGCWEC